MHTVTKDADEVQLPQPGQRTTIAARIQVRMLGGGISVAGRGATFNGARDEQPWAACPIATPAGPPISTA